MASCLRFNLCSVWASICTNPMAALTWRVPGDLGGGPSAGFVVFLGNVDSGDGGALPEGELVEAPWRPDSVVTTQVFGYAVPREAS